MELDPPDEEFFSSVSQGSKNSAIYLQKILKSKEYDPDNIFNQFFLTLKTLLKSDSFNLPDFLLSLLQHLCPICPPIVSKKLLLATEHILSESPSPMQRELLAQVFQPNWKKVEPETLDILFKAINFMPDRDELFRYAGELWKITSWKKAVYLASKFNFSDELENTYSAIDLLVKRDEIDLVFSLIANNKELASKAVRKMCTNKHCKHAGKIIDNSGLNPIDFPELVERLGKNSVRYFIHVDDISIYQLISIVNDTQDLLAYVAEELEFQGKKFADSWQSAIAAGIAQNFRTCPIRPNIRKILEGTVPRPISPSTDSFSPLQPEFDICFPLPRDTIHFINTLESLERVQFSGPIVGIDCEWRPSIVKFQKFKVSLIQIACEDYVYLIDLLALNTFPELDEKLSNLMQSNVYKVGVSFDGDVKMLNSSYPHLKAFEKPLKNYIDLVHSYGKVFGNSPGGLAGCCELLLKKGLCKYQQRSNWENRPLTESQTHYAALDAYVEILAMKELVANSGLELGDFTKLKKGSANKGINCDFCGSKAHNKNECRRGKRCKICYMTGHKASSCFN